ncbi:MAG TPA: TIGR04168 family protein [Candidatus Obscuribacterales bacterium]
MTDPAAQDQAFRIAVIGDVHDQWDDQDAAALQQLQVDLALFVGDFGNEAVEVVRAIAALEVPKAAIFGNHDAWYTATPWGCKKCPYDRTREDRVQTQIDLLGAAQVGYGKLEMPRLGVTVIGGRPFSWGGSEWKNASFYRDRYGVHDFTESVARLQKTIDAAQHDTLIFIGHCGPKGLGEAPEALCGRDWSPIGGDFGDPDLAAAIAYAHHQGKSVPLVTFGHMHHSLRHRKDRQRDRLHHAATDTVYLNAACVPRIVKTAHDCRRNFSLVTLQQGQVQQASLVWVDQALAVVAEESLYTRDRAAKSLQPLA